MKELVENAAILIYYVFLTFLLAFVLLVVGIGYRLLFPLFQTAQKVKKAIKRLNGFSILTPTKQLPFLVTQNS